MNERKHPVNVAQSTHRTGSRQLRLADAITAFAGSMAFVYIHILLFGGWLAAGTITGFDKYPFGMLTMVVSLEAIFLATFVMIGQNRQAAFQQAKADHDFIEQDTLLKRNTELTATTHDLTTEVHAKVVGVTTHCKRCGSPIGGGSDAQA